MSRFPFQVEVTRRMDYEMENWCREKFGPRWDLFDSEKGNWTLFWNNDETFSWRFKNEEDAILFAMRWKK